MSSDMTSSFDNIDAIPCDDVFDKPSGKSLHKYYNGSRMHENDIHVSIQRAASSDVIPLSAAVY